MSLFVNDKWLKEYKLSLKEVLAGLLCKLDAGSVLDNLVKQRKLYKDKDRICITQGFEDIIDSICLSSNPYLISYNVCLNLAKKLRTLVPQVRKENTPYYYVCNNAEVTLALQRFFYYFWDEIKDIKINDSVSDGITVYNDYFAVIINAVKHFYAGFTEENAMYFPLLKYFIIKIEGDEISSPLMSEIEMIRDGTDNKTERNS